MGMFCGMSDSCLKGRMFEFFLSRFDILLQKDQNQMPNDTELLPTLGPQLVAKFDKNFCSRDPTDLDPSDLGNDPEQSVGVCKSYLTQDSRDHGRIYSIDECIKNKLRL
ncbi:hypothetical protein T265_09130 [Opisthorchis viverrini]|uniref:Uncharacterized protein n=1 Tax=Opisthorchis viverrini TaxID=6198 RepID=A0A075A5Y5_OPIVI|nr:hypothetical protein T265_09130 [Opisthorchis viverrini]KER22854.1 hypothetical protein T265_09130 [Opisthorchis viverrini]